MKDYMKSLALFGLMASMGDTDYRNMDLSMRKRDTSKPRPSDKVLRKRKLQKQARKQNRK